MRNNELHGKNLVLITGVNGSIGSEIARGLLQGGSDVIGIFHRATEEIEGVYSRMLNASKGTLVLLDDHALSDPKSERLRVAIENFNRPITGVVHTAASIPRPKKFEQTEWDEFSAEFYVQVGLLHKLLSFLVNNQIADQGLSVVAISTVYAHNIPPPMLSSYVTTKSAMNGLLRALAVEYGPRGWRFNLVSPGMTESKMLVDVPNKARLLAKMNTPLRRIANPDDIAPIVEFLLSEKASHITGQNISVAGGLSV